MANLNKIIIIGNLTADPEMRFSVDGSAVTKFRLAVQRPVKSDGGEAGVDFIPVVAFARLAEICGEFLKKGKIALVEGRIQVKSYTTSDGQTKWSTEVVASAMKMLDKKGEAPELSSQELTSSPQESDDGLYDDIPF